MLIPQIAIAELVQRHAAVTPGCLYVLASMQVCCLAQISLERMLLVRPEIVNSAFDLLAVLSRWM